MGAKKDSFYLQSVAEDLFIEIFSEVFGVEKTKYLFYQYPVVDIYGRSRFIDFALECGFEKIAIEIDGERFHSPYKINESKYFDDLTKQNSLIYQNWKVYRWAYKQLKDQREKVKDELLTFLGELPYFREFEEFLPKQKGKVFELKTHQQEALKNLEEMRRRGETIALLYHATGTGKTVTAITDAKNLGLRTLFLAHTKELVYQAKNKFLELWPGKTVGLFLEDKREKDSYIVCGSVQSVSQNLEYFYPEDFGYLIIDEAHHSAADTYRKILGYFKPKFTLGLTATPERMDGENILEMFKNVAHKLDLKTAVEIGELVPIRCIRVKTNVDISDVRFNGIKYNSQDLESKIFIPERNKIIVETYLNYVKNKKTVIFCASVKHAEEIAKLLQEKGVNAKAVSGKMSSTERNNILKEYEYGSVDVLCACDLLNEGWDSPRTEVLFMARPTMSKTIYLQQLGRGTRKAPGKEYLLVFDFIDNANLFNMPLSLHRLFKIDKYRPLEYVLAPEDLKKQEDKMLMVGEKPAVYLDFPVEVTDYEYVELFNWQDKVSNMVSQLEFVRMVDVQSETIARYIREGKIIPDFQVPVGSKTFNYFEKETVHRYARQYGWKIITQENLKEIFLEMVKKMDMSYSYKPVLLKAMLTHADEQGRVLLEDVVNYFLKFYEDRRQKGLVVEKKNSIYCQENPPRNEVLRNILANPFKRFEDMRIMRKAKDLEYIEFNPHIWRKLTVDEKDWILSWCDQKLEEYFSKLKDEG
ncbi:DEAD/DEAH box helicase [Carboxydothermus islandicus]|uniref:DEAD/DEAH box helicase n=1 Tax=Carboxydothermus islandicus TaxID=661089 RepID=A0A1L8D220_9THEO|nr:DEAD/DEAH box helicase family protein [Carboxydothermus islandicus]GAV25193.1 DEAD/DEAH box helicase [Carboxydothermus islandicus]